MLTWPPGPQSGSRKTTGGGVGKPRGMRDSPWDVAVEVKGQVRCQLHGNLELGRGGVFCCVL